MAKHLAPTGASREPAAVIGAVGTAVASVVALVVAFGVDLTGEQQAAILGVVAGVGPLVVGLLIRPKVSAVSTTVATVAPSGAVLAGGASVLPTGVRVSDRATVGALLTDDDDPDDVGDGRTSTRAPAPIYDPAWTDRAT